MPHPHGSGAAVTNATAPRRRGGLLITAVLDAGLQLTGFQEHLEAESQTLPMMVTDDHGRYVLPKGRERLPLMYILQAFKPASGR